MRLRSHYLHFEWSYKRLEEGTYAIPSAEPNARRIEMTPEELGALLGNNIFDIPRDSAHT